MFKGRLSLLLLIGLLVLVLPACAGTPAAPMAPTMPPLPTEAGQPAQAAPASGLGIIQSVTMAGDVAADTFEPVNPTINFVNPPVLHVVVTIQDAPADTAVRVDWFSGSAGTAPPDASLGTYSITADGSRNLDYSFIPGAQMTPGAYYVRVFLNEQFFLRVNFYVTAQ
jgi:hypothetical protein